MKNKTIEILEKKGLQANNGIKFTPLKRADFPLGGYTEYTYAVAVLSDRLYAYQTKQAGFDSVQLQLNAVNNHLRLTAAEMEIVADYIARGGLVTAVKPYRRLNDESETQRCVLRAEIERAEASGKAEAIETARQAYSFFMRFEARYELEIAEQNRYGGFRRSFEQIVARTLAKNITVKAAMQAAKQAKYADMWGKWCGKAALLGIDCAAYVDNDDIGGLKAAVRAAYEASKEASETK